MGFGKPDDVDLLNPGGAKDLLERAPVGVAAFKPRIGRLVFALFHRGVDGKGGDGLVKLGLGCPRQRVRRPRVDEIRRLRKVRAGVDVPILRCDDHCVFVGVLGDEIGDPLGRRVASFDCKRSALAERRLNIDDDECPCLGHVSLQIPVAPEDGAVLSRYREF